MADQHHVAAGVQVRIDARLDPAHAVRRGHADVVGEDHAAEAHLLAQDVVDPARRVAGRRRGDLRIGHVRQHHRVGAGVDAGDERQQVRRLHLRQRTVIHRGIEMGVFRHRTVAGEVLERGGHAGLVHAFDVGAGEGGHDLRIVGEGAVADGEVAAAEVDHRREAEVHAGGADLAGHQPGVLAGQRQGGVGIVAVQRVEALQRRQRAVAVAEALHAPAFLVDADELRARRGFADGLRQLGHLRARGEVAGEQDHAGAGVVLQPVALLRGEFVAGYADLQHQSCSFTSRAARSSPRHCEYGREASARL